MSGSLSSRTSSASDKRSAVSRLWAPADRARRATFGPAMNEIKIGLLGLGTVGSGVVKVLQNHGADMEERAGCRLRLHAIADAELTRPREGLDLKTLPLVNDTCNYILSKMTDEGLDFSMVLKEAQAQGYAEADPTLDIEGMDSAHKLQILATIAFRTAVDLKDIHTEGITGIAPQDVENAAELGYRIKLLAIAKTSDGALEARVHPTMIPAASPMAAVSGVFNAVFITGDNVGNLMFYGRGAGQLPTASAVWSDTLEIARRVAHGVTAMEGHLAPISARPSRPSTSSPWSPRARP